MRKLIKLYQKIRNIIYVSFFGRVSLLRKLGGQVGTDCRFIGNIDFGSEPYLIKIGDHVSITSSYFVNHDGGVWVLRDEFPSIDVVKPICIGNNVFIGSQCIIMPGVNVGDNVVIGAGSVVTKSLESNGVYAGVPARFIKSLSDYKNSSLASNLNTKDLSGKKGYLQRFYKR